MEEFHSEINQLRSSSQQLENVDVNHFVDEIEQIGQQLKTSEEFLLKEIQRLKTDLDANHSKLNYANELREIDAKTLNTFRTKFQDLTQLLADVKKKETNAWHIVQILRVNTSRLWHIFEAAAGVSATDKLINGNLEKILNSAQIEKDEQTTCLILLEKEHGDLLIKMKEIQLSVEHFRTTILEITKNTNETKLKVKKQQQINDHIHEQSSKRINHLTLNIKDVQILLVDYKFLINEIHDLVKLIFHIQTQIEIHNKTKFLQQTKLEKYKQDLSLKALNRTKYENQIYNLQKIIHQQNQNFQQLKSQQKQIIENRQELYKQIDSLEIDKNQIFTNQQQLVDTIKQSNLQRNLLDKEIFHKNHTIQNLQYSYRKLFKDYNKQQNITNHLQKASQANEQNLHTTKIEIDKFTEQVQQQNYLINYSEAELDSHTKDLQELENCLSITHEELSDQRTKVNESKTNVRLLKHKLHKIIGDEKPLAKEISQYRKQVLQNETNSIQLELNLKQNESKMNHYKKIIGKLICDSKQNDNVLMRENASLEKCHRQIKQSKENIKMLNKNLKNSESNYQSLKEIFYQAENENRLLKQQYKDLTFVIELLGYRQATTNNKLGPLYRTVKQLTKQHVDQANSIEQSKFDFNILQKYYSYLRLHNQRLRESISFKSQQHNEYLKSQSISNQSNNFQNQLQLQMNKTSNHIHYWHILMASSPDKFNNISKLFLIKKKIVHKTDELVKLKKFFREKEILYHYLNQIYERREKLREKNKC
ncbi:unnamed protein product [Rotaria magnacalcarata]|uniref:Uncharacterized protein n=2 Tax=Rotaria magnacalcarata TaxID=392030 RepID=A0A816U2V1_9BILA|nr:unnamed protein product [Rotaria magnacalcarata]CAF2102663.1 unnamed protein product [Rotaria magnacalcarata]CAF3876746.1 unnamed protein product [Rotaria magnacalcarata]CAF3939538.1 unnamed protein product [Rotaria magnacalcarata]